MIECLPYEFERVSRPEKIYVYFLVCNTGAQIFSGQLVQYLDVELHFGGRLTPFPEVL
jgi:hypothetical protein